MGMVFVPAAYATFIVKEREDGSKHLQLISGVSAVSYWVSNLLWDCLNYTIPAIGAALIIIAYGDVNLGGDNFGVLVLGLILYGLSVIPFTYCMSFLFKSHSTAQNVMIMVYLLGGIVLTMVQFTLYSIPSTRSDSEYVRHFFRLIPNYCLADCIFYMAVRGFLELGRWDNEVCGYDFAYMCWEAFIYFFLTLAIEYASHDAGALRTLKSLAGAAPPHIPTPDEVDLDEDVLAEKRRIQAGEANKELIRLQGLRRVFPPSKVAVEDLWFAIPEGQCFGFLGVNGAGKTTTLRMITGDEIPTTGTAYLGGYEIQADVEQVRRIMGYCPQFDALHELLTGMETLEFYGRIRGIPESGLRSMADYLIQRLSLGPYANRTSGKYSGGNKRKLSVAIALIGNPPIVFLDEPSTGIDPVSRRFMWDFISETMSGRAVILTTHSMEECEALCSRIGIIGAGRLQCLGSSQHLKTRFGRGLQLDISTGEQDVHQAREFILSAFPGAEELECYGGKLKFKVTEQKRSLADIFSIIEANKEKVLISEYSVGQTTLEQIFINFARDTDMTGSFRKAHPTNMAEGDGGAGGAAAGAGDINGDAKRGDAPARVGRQRTSSRDIELDSRA
jgi:ABC-type multidrug transport system ATPase subunit